MVAPQLTQSLAALFLTLSTPAFASDSKVYGHVEATVIEVHDGDTLKVNIDDWPRLIGDGVGVRVYGVDCRELKTGAVTAKDTVKSWIKPGDKVWLMSLRRDKYFRVLASVGFDCKIQSDGVQKIECKDLGGELIHHKLAVPYFGEKKKDFPEDIK